MIPTSPAQQVDQAFIYILGISVVILFFITATMIYFAIKYRRDKHPVPADIRGNWKLEVLWTIIPTIIALSMFYIGWNSYVGLRNVPPGAIEIQASGEMYAWIFVYPNEKETAGELIVPLGKPIKLNISSLDVLHSLFIPAFRIKVDAVKGVPTYAWFLADRLGEFSIKCTEFCGVGHSEMTAVLKIVPEEEYLAWLEEEGGDDGWGDDDSKEGEDDWDDEEPFNDEMQDDVEK